MGFDWTLLAWVQPQPDWARQCLLVVRLIAQHELTVAEIMKIADVSRQTVFTYRDKLVAGGVVALLRRGKAPGNQTVVRGAVQTEFLAHSAAGKFRRAKDAQAWISKRTRKTLTESGVRKVLRRLGGKLKAPRKSHAKRDSAKARRSKWNCRPNSRRSPAPPRGLASQCACGCSMNTATACGQSSAELGVYAEFRACALCHALPVGRSAQGDGSRRRQPTGTAVDPCIDQDVHALFLQQLGATESAALHVVIQDQAGFHLPANDPRLPKNVRLLPLPPYSPELNPVEKLVNLVKDRICTGSIRACAPGAPTRPASRT